MGSHTPVERLAPIEGDPYAACAGTLLFGHALIIGGGRQVAVDTAHKTNCVTSLTVIEREKAYEISKYGTKLRLCDFNDYKNDIKYESIFFDLFPAQSELASKAIEMLLPNGRIIWLGGLYSDELFDEYIADRYKIFPGRESRKGNWINIGRKAKVG